ncbi:MAG: ParA family protein [Lachnospiraceae bacterium]|nr:ParA family protein [Lachnospiraceae bacterium]
MSKIIVCANEKGGVAKTTTTVNLGIGLAKRGKRVLVIDNDPQGSLTVALGFHNPGQMKYTMSTVYNHVIEEEEFDPRESILHHKEGVDLIPANNSLNSVEKSLVNVCARETMLGEYIEMIRDDYDYIIIDCSPSLGMLTFNALVAGDEIIIPVQPTFLAVKGLEELLKVIYKLRKKFNPSLEIKGILLTMVDSRTNYAKDIAGMLDSAYGANIYIFKNKIPHSVRAAEATTVGQSIYEYDPKGTVAAAYEALTAEVIA